MKLNLRWITSLLLIVTALQLASCAPAAIAKSKIAPSKVEPIAGSEFKRVVLTEKAAKRLDIQTVLVREERVTRTLKLGGRVLDPSAKPASAALASSAGASSASVADQDRARVRVRLTEGDINRVDQSQTAHVLALDDDDETEGAEAEVDEGSADDAEDANNEEDARTVYYAVDNLQRNLAPGQPVLVEVTVKGSGEPRKIVPFAAVLYGLHGETWVYTSPEPLAFVRQPVTIDYIEEGVAVLAKGPPAGTAVVTVGGAELYGAETGVSK